MIFLKLFKFFFVKKIIYFYVNIWVKIHDHRTKAVIYTDWMSNSLSKNNFSTLMFRIYKI